MKRYENRTIKLVRRLALRVSDCTCQRSSVVSISELYSKPATLLPISLLISDTDYAPISTFSYSSIVAIWSTIFALEVHRRWWRNDSILGPSLAVEKEETPLHIPLAFWRPTFGCEQKKSSWSYRARAEDSRIHFEVIVRPDCTCLSIDLWLGWLKPTAHPPPNYGLDDDDPKGHAHVWGTLTKVD